MSAINISFTAVFSNGCWSTFGRDLTNLSPIIPDGLFICLEKCTHEDADEYLRRENQKDLKFKTRFYSRPQLIEKEETIIKTMQYGQVTVSRLNSAIKESLKHTKLIWNSCNFYIIAASNDPGKLEFLMTLLGPTCIQSEFEYENIPVIPKMGADLKERSQR